MARITAQGTLKQNDYYYVPGVVTVTIEGGRKVEEISASKVYIDHLLKKMIRERRGWMANNYHPEAGTMLQAYATCLLLFKEQDIRVEGDIGEMESEPGLVY